MNLKFRKQHLNLYTNLFIIWHIRFINDLEKTNHFFGKMMRLMRSKSGRQIYGPKWQNINEIERDENALPSASIESVRNAHQDSDAHSMPQNNHSHTPEGLNDLFI